MFHEFDDIAINKTAKDRAIIENLICYKFKSVFDFREDKFL
jgi:hypothetical protein